MNILITAGGTREDIDAVRGITNYATGRLGSLIADTFVESGANVTYICGVDSILPTKKTEVIRIRAAMELLKVVEKLLAEQVFDCVIHSMAVSDYTPQRVTTIDGTAISGNDTKISSDVSEIMVYLKQTPKIIGRFKELQPSAVLVGFKLLLNVTENELIDAARRLLEKNACDYVLANDLSDIKGDLHKAVLIDKNSIINRANTKQEIAEMVHSAVGRALARPVGRLA